MARVRLAALEMWRRWRRGQQASLDVRFPLVVLVQKSLALQHATLHQAARRAAQLLQSLGHRTVEGLRQQEAEAAGGQAAQTEHGEGHGGVEGPH